MIDLYCERMGPGFWDEPLNAATNIAFIIAAVIVWNHRVGNDTPIHRSLAPGIGVLAVLIGTIGIGSFLFHTFATETTRLLDVLSLVLFQVTFLALYLRNVLRWTFPATVLALLAFLATAGTARLFPDPLNGSLPYLPGLAALVALGWDDYRRRRPQPLGLLSAGLVFLVAVILRSADLALCDIMTSGTHFAWHLGAACVAGMATLGYARNTRHAPR